MSKTSEDLDRLETERRDVLQALFWEGDGSADKRALEGRLHEIDDRIDKWQRGLIELEEEERRDTEEEEHRLAQLRAAQLEELDELMERKRHIAEELDGRLYDIPELLKEYLEIGREAYVKAQGLDMENADLCLSDEHLIGYVRALLWGVLPVETLEPGPVYKRKLSDMDTERRHKLVAR